mmetsp:Transcript_25653/g.64412  ORF Transcript_25653/g.64412 Transcript_25653/m.64412 type:complete len:322 (-) Transcript_25653:311-1276(-)
MFLRVSNGLLVDLDSGRVVQRADQGAFFQGITDGKRRVGLGETSHHLVVYLLVNDQATSRSAPLTSCTHRGKGDTSHGHVQIRIFVHDHCVVTAQLQKRLAKASSHSLTDLTSDSSATGEGEQVHPTVIGHGLTDLGGATGERTHRTGQSVAFEHASDDALSGHTAETHRRGRLPQGAVTAHHAECTVPAVDGDREVERRDHTHQAHRVPVLVHLVAGTLRRDHLAVEHAAQTHGVVADVHVLLHLANALHEDLAHLQRLEFAERIQILAQLVTDLTDDLATLGGGQVTPLSLGLVRLRDGLLVFVNGGSTHTGDRLVGRR